MQKEPIQEISNGTQIISSKIQLSKAPMEKTSVISHLSILLPSLTMTITPFLTNNLNFILIIMHSSNYLQWEPETQISLNILHLILNLSLTQYFHLMEELKKTELYHLTTFLHLGKTFCNIMQMTTSNIMKMAVKTKENLKCI